MLIILLAIHDWTTILNVIRSLDYPCAWLPLWLNNYGNLASSLNVFNQILEKITVGYSYTNDWRTMVIPRENSNLQDTNQIGILIFGWSPEDQPVGLRDHFQLMGARMRSGSAKHQCLNGEIFGKKNCRNPPYLANCSFDSWWLLTTTTLGGS